MPGPADYEKIPESGSPLLLPDFGFDDLEKGDRIGTGGDSDVYRATVYHSGNKHTVAVKEPRFEGTIQNQAFEKFRTEAETWSSLSDHDNIVSVYAWGTEPLPWLCMEFMDGGTLDEQVGSLELAEALWLSGRIAEGIRHGHRHGVAHLDIKPTNVLLRNTPSGKWDYPKVSDWGLAKMLLEHSNSVEGISPTYAAPEQFDPETFGDPDDFTDIYQLGAVVYALLTGEPPFTGPSTTVMRSVLEDEPAPPSAVNPNLPDVVDKVVLKALAKQKNKRYESIVIFRRTLDRLLAELIDARGGVTGSERTQSTDRSADSHTQSHGQGASNNGRRSLVTRRRAIGVLGIGAVGLGGGWMATQMDDAGTDIVDKTVSTAVPRTKSTETPIIESISVSNPTGQQLLISFDSSKVLATIQVDITGVESTTLTTEEFIRADTDDDTHSYKTTYIANSDGGFLVKLKQAVDRNGNNWARDHHSAQFVLDTVNQTAGSDETLANGTSNGTSP
jgi:serine/threonine protein kinase